MFVCILFAASWCNKRW